MLIPSNKLEQHSNSEISSLSLAPPHLEMPILRESQNYCGPSLGRDLTSPTTQGTEVMINQHRRVNVMTQTITGLKALIFAAKEKIAEMKATVEMESSRLDRYKDRLSRLEYAVRKVAILKIVQTKPLNHGQFRNSLSVHMHGHADCLDRNCKYVVETMSENGKKRCKAGRPKGKILKFSQGNSLSKRLCSFHQDAEGFNHRTNNLNQDPWKCWPVNAEDE
jgi:hypothetical protein